MFECFSVFGFSLAISMNLSRFFLPTNFCNNWWNATETCREPVWHIYVIFGEIIKTTVFTELDNQFSVFRVRPINDLRRNAKNVHLVLSYCSSLLSFPDITRLSLLMLQSSFPMPLLRSRWFGPTLYWYQLSFTKQLRSWDLCRTATYAQCPLPLSIVIRIRLIIRQSKLPACLAEVQLAHWWKRSLWHLCHRTGEIAR